MILFRIMQLSFEFCVSDATYIEHTQQQQLVFILHNKYTHKRHSMIDSRYEKVEGERKGRGN